MKFTNALTSIGLFWLFEKTSNLFRILFDTMHRVSASIDDFIIRWTRLFITVFWLIGFPCFIYLAFFQNSNPIIINGYSNPHFYKPTSTDGMYSFRYTKSFCITSPVDMYILPQFTNGLTFNVPNKGLVHYDTGCYTQIIPVDIPPEFVNGEYTYSVEYEVILNTLGIPTRTLHLHYNVFTLDVVDQAKGVYTAVFNTNLKPVPGNDYHETEN